MIVRSGCLRSRDIPLTIPIFEYDGSNRIFRSDENDVIFVWVPIVLFIVKFASPLEAISVELLTGPHVAIYRDLVRRKICFIVAWIYIRKSD